MATTKSNLITNLDAVPAVMNEVGKSGGRIRIAQDDFEVATGNFQANDIVHLCRLPSNARILQFKLYVDAAGGSCTTHAGLYTTAGAVVDIDFFATAVDISSAVTGTDIRFEAANITTMSDRLWENAAASSDPGGHYDISLTCAANSASDFTCGFQIYYVVD